MLGIKDYEFKGFSWIELAEYFKVPESEKYCEDYDEDRALFETRAKLREVMRTISSMYGFYNYENGTNEDVINVRRFLDKIIKDPEVAEEQLWIGLSKVTNDWSFIKFVVVLLQDMWT